MKKNFIQVKPILILIWVLTLGLMHCAADESGYGTHNSGDESGTGSTSPTSSSSASNTSSSNSSNNSSQTSSDAGVAADATEEADEETEENTLTTEDPSFFYFSYDDSASTVGVELSKYYLNHNRLPDESFARPWEFLSYESFSKEGLAEIGKFKVSMGLWAHKDPSNENGSIYDLGVLVTAPTITKEERKQAVITLVLDVSGSMAEPGTGYSNYYYGDSNPSKIEIMKHGVKQMVMNSLKEGDVLNIVSFSTTAWVTLEGWHFTSQWNSVTDTINAIVPTDSTNLNEGIELGYDLALEYYDAQKVNRVIICTDAYANTGEVDPEIISNHTRINNAEGIYFSGIGFGLDFNEAFLNELTEAGKGAYFSAITTYDASRAFTDRFIALLNVAARDVMFKLDFPTQTAHITSAAEEMSTVEAEVQTTNFSYNTAQFFLEGFKVKEAEGLSDQTFKLTITYKDPESFEKKTEVIERKVADLIGQETANIMDAHIIVLLTRLIGHQTNKETVLKDIDLNYQGVSSRLFTEYQGLIQKYLNLRTD